MVARGGGGFEEGIGTSYAAPYVAAILADMHDRCGIGGAALVKLILKQADSSGRYRNSEKYGAGLITRDRALRACR